MPCEVAVELGATVVVVLRVLLRREVSATMALDASEVDGCGVTVEMGDVGVVYGADDAAEGRRLDA